MLSHVTYWVQALLNWAVNALSVLFLYQALVCLQHGVYHTVILLWNMPENSSVLRWVIRLLTKHTYTTLNCKASITGRATSVLHLLFIYWPAMHKLSSRL